MVSSICPCAAGVGAARCEKGDTYKSQAVPSSTSVPEAASKPWLRVARHAQRQPIPGHGAHVAPLGLRAGLRLIHPPPVALRMYPHVNSSATAHKLRVGPGHLTRCASSSLGTVLAKLRLGSAAGSRPAPDCPVHAPMCLLRS